MVNFCAVYGCSNRSNREKDRSFFRLPAIITRPNDEKQAFSKERRATWLARIQRDDLSSNPNDFVRVCSDHFLSLVRKEIYTKTRISEKANDSDFRSNVVVNLKVIKCILGKPSSIYDKDNTDWAPSQKLGYDCNKVTESS